MTAAQQEGTTSTLPACSLWPCASIPAHTAPSSAGSFSCLSHSITTVCQERFIFPPSSSLAICFSPTW